MKITLITFLLLKRAEDWNLAKPLATCSLIVKRVDESLVIQLFTEKPKKDGPDGATEEKLFAQCKAKLDLKTEGVAPKLDYWVEAVVDSSRYFVIRIVDEQSSRSAHIGMGFRERNDALNFKMSLDDYTRSMKKEAIIEKNASHAVESTEESNQDHKESEIQISKLSLKEGEKIHINIKGHEKKVAHAKPKSGGGLRKPPPPAIANGYRDDVIGKSSKEDPVENDDDEEDDDWGDFEEA